MLKWNAHCGKVPLNIFPFLLLCATMGRRNNIGDATCLCNRLVNCSERVAYPSNGPLGLFIIYGVRAREPFVEALRSDSASFCRRRRPRSAVGILRVAIRRVIAGCKNTSARCPCADYLSAPLEVNAASFKRAGFRTLLCSLLALAFYRRRQLESSFIRRRRKNGIIKFKAGPLSTAYSLFYSGALRRDLSRTITCVRSVGEKSFLPNTI
jgi:hypothetical protein